MIQVRNGCFETNSSSSHSVCISMDSEIDESIKDLIENDTLYIYPRNGVFPDMRTNKCLDKLQYVVSLVCGDVSTVQGSKKIKHLRYRLKKLLGVSNVYIGHVDEYYAILRSRKGKMFRDKYDYDKFLLDNFKLSCIKNDNIVDEIFETQETFGSFILSPNSWLYITEGLGSGEDFAKFRNSMYCNLYGKNDSIITIDYTPDLKVEFEDSIFDDSVFSGSTFKSIYRNYANNIILDEDSNKLVWNNSDTTQISMIGDKYNLIKIESDKNDVPCSEDGICGKLLSGSSSTIKEHTIDRFKLPSYAKSYKAWPISIRSSEFIGDLVL